MSFLTDPQNAEFWIAIALVVFLFILWRVKVPGLAAKALDDAGAKVQAQLDEAKRLREEAQALLEDVKRRKVETEAAAEEMMRSAQEDVTRLRQEAAVRLGEDVKRRAQLAERKIALAEAQAANEVKSAAADLAAQVAEGILASRLAANQGRDPTLGPAIDRVRARLAG